MKQKVSLGFRKGAWHPSPLVGQIVLVTTVNEDGSSNVAPKSWISMMAGGPSILALGCTLTHWAARNILHRREFVVNVPGAELARQVWDAHRLPHPRTVEAAGFTAIPAETVRPPRIEECKAHLECELDHFITYGDEVILFGQVTAVSVDREALDAEDPYAYLQMFVYLQGGMYGVVEQARRVAGGAAAPLGGPPE